eukprot:9134226-Alexandrium_andersonii.AAC.1
MGLIAPEPPVGEAPGSGSPLNEEALPAPPALPALPAQQRCQRCQCCRRLWVSATEGSGAA